MVVQTIGLNGVGVFDEASYESSTALMGTVLVEIIFRGAKLDSRPWLVTRLYQGATLQCNT